MITGLFLRIVQQDIETSRQCDDELLCEFVGMPSLFFSTWNIIDPVAALDFEGNLLIFLQNREIASFINKLW